MNHPKGIILDILSEAGTPLSRIHDTTERIQAAYTDANDSGPHELPADPFASLKRNSGRDSGGGDA